MATITSCEFAHLLQSCRPPSGWGTITVALSGGPDSLGLLHLLRNHCPALPLRSITVDHGLQSTSRASAIRTHERAVAMGVPNVVLPAEWSGPIDSGRAFEEAARQARYQALWRGLWNDDSPGPRTLMFAHHADDQLETVLMRVLRGTGTYGMGGMRALRRWGMVGVNSEEMLKGMNTWLCRPLLSIPKDRLVATCAVHGLDYEVDKTNFMPELTIRNAFRHALVDPSATRPELAAVIARVHALCGGSTNSAPDVPRMRSYVERMSARVREVDEIVSAYLSRHTHPSPPSTLLLIPNDLDTLPPDASHALVHRILRYVSPHPWGSVQSEGGRKSSSTQRILDTLQSNSTTPFTVGAQVLWSPATIRPDGSIRTRSIETRAGSKAWLASRLPTPRATPLEMETLPGSVIWDNRFLVHVPGSGRVLIGPEGRYLSPRVMRVSENGRASDVGRVEPEKVRANVEFIRELDAI